MKYLYILLYLCAFIACKESNKVINTTTIQDSNTTEIIVSASQFTSQNMQLGELDTYTFNSTISATGTIDVPPKNKAIISSFMGGYITKSPLLVGNQVKKGQSLVTLENPDFIELQKQYLEVFEQLNYLEAEYLRQKQLFSENITSKKNYLKAESMYKSNLAHYHGLEKKLGMLNINPELVKQGKISSTIQLYSPITGDVSKVNVSGGMYVSPADVILEIVDTSHIHLELSVFEKDIMNVKKGQNIIFNIPESSGENYEAEVYLVGTTIDKTSRIVEVHGHIPDESTNHFIVGMFIQAQIVIDSAESQVLPKEAILQDGNKSVVLALKEKKNKTYAFEKVSVDIGNQTEHYAEISNANVLEGKQILTKGGFMLIH